MSLDEALALGDFHSLHMPLTPGTKVRACVLAVCVTCLGFQGGAGGLPLAAHAAHAGHQGRCMCISCVLRILVHLVLMVVSWRCCSWEVGGKVLDERGEGPKALRLRFNYQHVTTPSVW